MRMPQQGHGETNAKKEQGHDEAKAEKEGHVTYHASGSGHTPLPPAYEAAIASGSRSTVFDVVDVEIGGLP